MLPSLALPSEASSVAKLVQPSYPEAVNRALNTLERAAGCFRLRGLQIK